MENFVWTNNLHISSSGSPTKTEDRSMKVIMRISIVIHYFVLI